MEIKKLNTLRGLAALIVVVSHYSNASHFLFRVLGNGAGQMGVMLFFLLSGFLMSYLYLDKDYSASSIYRFIIARFARVVPLFLAVICGSYALYLFNIPNVLYDIPTFNEFLSHLFLFFGTNVLWTIPAEIQFYILFVGLWGLYRWKPIALYLLIALTSIALVVMDFPRPEGTLLGLAYDWRLPQSLPYFFLGVLFGKFYHHADHLKKYKHVIWLLPFCLLPLFYPSIFQVLFGLQNTLWDQVWLLGVIGFIFFATVFMVPDDNILIANPIGDFLGKISYSLYLLHIPVLMQIESVAKENPYLWLIPFLGLSVGVSYVSYRFLEAPSRRFFRRLI